MERIDDHLIDSYYWVRYEAFEEVMAPPKVLKMECIYCLEQ